MFALMFVCSLAHAQTSFTDLRFSRFQVADSQWNVNACMNTATCQIYSKNPGIAYRIPWTSGQLSWATGDYIKFELSGNANFPYTARQYTSAGALKSTLGSGKVINAGADYFFFMGSDNNTGQLFSGTVGMNNTAGVTWTGTRNPTIEQMNTSSSNYSATPLASGETAPAPAPPPPALAGGASAAAFSPNQTNTTKLNTFVSRTTGDSQVTIEQIGNFNTTAIVQSGTRNNYSWNNINGSNNSVTVNQSGTAGTIANYAETGITGNNNTVTLTQQSTGGSKSAFVSITNSNNVLQLQQKDSGSHYAEVNLRGGNKTVNVLQQGGAAHRTAVELTGLSTELSLTQSGATQQFYSINFNCATAGGCPKITVTQGQ